MPVWLSRQVVRALQGKTFVDSPDQIMSDECHDSTAYFSQIAVRGGSGFVQDFNDALSLVPLFLYGHHEKAIEVGNRVVDSLHCFWSFRIVPLSFFYLSLAILSFHLDNPLLPDRQAALNTVKKYKSEVDFYRKACDANYGMWSLILEALIAEVSGDFAGVVHSFEVSATPIVPP